MHIVDHFRICAHGTWLWLRDARKPREMQYLLWKVTVLSDCPESSFPFLCVRRGPDFRDLHFLAESYVPPKENLGPWKVGGRPDTPKVQNDTLSHLQKCVLNTYGVPQKHGNTDSTHFCPWEMCQNVFSENHAADRPPKNLLGETGNSLFRKMGGSGSPEPQS